MKSTRTINSSVGGELVTQAFNVLSRGWKTCQSWWQTAPWVVIMLGLVVVSVWYVWPFLRYPALNLIDDGLSIQVAHTLHADYSWHNWLSQLYETQFGRLRPVYWLYWYVVVNIFGSHPASLWLLQAAHLVVTMGLVTWIVTQLTGRKSVGIVTALSILLLPSLVENIYRLGPAEPRQVIFMLGFVAWLLALTKRTHVSLSFAVGGWLLLVLALLAKETSLVLGGVIGLVWLVKLITGQWRQSAYIALGVSLILTVVGVLLLIPPATNYASGYQPTVMSIKDNLFVVRASQPELFWLLGLALLMTLFRVTVVGRYKQSVSWLQLIAENYWQAVCLGLVVGLVGLTIPWQYQLERYYYPAQVFILMYVALEAAAMWQAVSARTPRQHDQWDRQSVVKMLFESGVVFSALLFMTGVIFLPGAWRLDRLISRMRVQQPVWFGQYHYSYPLITFVMTEVKPHAHVYMAHRDYEVIYELGLYASLFGDRPVTVLSEEPLVNQDFGNQYVTVADVYASFKTDPSLNKVLVVRGLPRESMEGYAVKQLWPQPSQVVKDDKQVWSVMQ